jgi:hypothetical protein
MHPHMKNTNKFTSTTTPAVQRFYFEGEGSNQYQWKVSPHGPADADRDATWCDSKAEAVALASQQV